jgi:hypothetical protein
MDSHSTVNLADLREQVMHECAAMARYALASGKKVPAQVMADVEKIRLRGTASPADVAALVRIHDHLTTLVAPATPRAILLLGDEEHASTSKVAWLGHVGIARRMMLVATVSTLLFLAVSISDYVNDPTRTLIGAKGWEAFAIELWWVSAAAMGASFAMLMQVSDYIVKRTYDPKYEPVYWIKFLLGIMSGLILAGLVPIPEGHGPISEMGKPTLALLGGFSASAVHRIMIRLVETIESLFRPTAKDEVAQRERAAQMRATEETNNARVSLATQIVKLQQQVATGAVNGDISASLQQMLHALLPESALHDLPAPAGTVAVGNIPIVAAPEGPAADADAAPAEEGDSAPVAAADAPASTEDASAATATAQDAAG